MSFAKRLRVAFLCATLQLGVLTGVPMRPDEIQELMHRINKPKLAHVLPTDEDDGDVGVTTRLSGRSG